MDKKPVVNLHDLTQLLAAKVDLSERDAVNFLNELLDIISDKSITNQGVEIDSLGSFKVEHINYEVEDIESVYKFDFSPHKSFVNAINKPFVNFEPTTLNKDTVLQGVQIVNQKTDEAINLDDASILFVEKKEMVVEVVDDEEIIEDIVEDVGTEIETETEQELEEEQELEIVVEHDAPIEIVEENITPPPVNEPQIYRRSSRTNKKRKNALALVVSVGVVMAITASAFFFQTRTDR